MSTESHSIEIMAPAAARRKGTTVSLRNLITAALDKELIITQEGTTTREASKSHGHMVKSVTVTFNYQEEGNGGEGK